MLSAAGRRPDRPYTFVNAASPVHAFNFTITKRAQHHHPGAMASGLAEGTAFGTVTANQENLHLRVGLLWHHMESYDNRAVQLPRWADTRPTPRVFWASLFCESG